jgi:hypothetical protein
MLSEKLQPKGWANVEEKMVVVVARIANVQMELDVEDFRDEIVGLCWARHPRKCSGRRRHRKKVVERRLFRPVVGESEDGREMSVACLASMTGATTTRTWGLKGAAKAKPKEKKNIGGRPSAPKEESSLAEPWEERGQKRATWSEDGASYKGLEFAVARADWQSCSCAGWCCC